MKISAFFIFVLSLLWTANSWGAYPSDCYVDPQTEKWFKKAPLVGQSEYRQMCIDTRDKKISWHNNAGDLLGSIEFTNINKDKLRAKPPSTSGLIKDKRTYVIIPLYKMEKGRTELRLYCDRDCTVKAIDFVTYLRDAINGKPKKASQSSNSNVRSTRSSKPSDNKEPSYTEVKPLQRIISSSLQKNDLKAAEEAAMKIQKIAHTYLAKKEASKLKERENTKKAYNAARRLQKVIRGHQARKEFKKLYEEAQKTKAEAAKRLRTTLKVAQAVGKFKKGLAAKRMKEESVVKLQAKVREYLQQKKIAQADASATIIESIARAHLAKKEFQKAKEAASKLQEAIRSYNSYKKIMRFRQAVEDAEELKKAADLKQTSFVSSQIPTPPGPPPPPGAVPPPPPGAMPPPASGAASNGATSKPNSSGKDDLLAAIRDGKNAKTARFNNKKAKQQAQANAAAAAADKERQKQENAAALARAAASAPKVDRGRTNQQQDLFAAIRNRKGQLKSAKKGSNNKITDDLRAFVQELAANKVRMALYNKNTSEDDIPNALKDLFMRSKTQDVEVYLKELNSLIKAKTFDSDDDQMKVAKWLKRGLEIAIQDEEDDELSDDEDYD